MFEKLIESDSAAADFKGRRSYFVVSSVVVGILFLSAVVFSIYAAEIGLGSDDFELSTLLHPVTMPDRTSEPDVRPSETSGVSDELPSRPANIPRMNEHPVAPTSLSVTPNTEMTRPPGRFKIRDGLPSSGSGFGPTRGDRNHQGTSASSTEEGREIVERKPVQPPPPRVVPSPPKTPRSLGVVNGLARHLPKPPYPAPARAVGADGEVSVQVTIDETGKVISARAVSGHRMLRAVSESAAAAARFSPTLLSNVPVKVTGVIVYKFSRG